MKTYRGIFEKVLGSSVFWIRYVDAHGRYRREKAGTFSQAQKLLVKRQNEKIVGKKLPESLRRAPVTFSVIADDALEYSRLHKRSYRDDKSNAKRLKEWFGNRDAESITAPELESRLNEQARTEKWASSTFNQYRSAPGRSQQIRHATSATGRKITLVCASSRAKMKTGTERKASTQDS